MVKIIISKNVGSVWENIYTFLYIYTLRMVTSLIFSILNNSQVWCRNAEPDKNEKGFVKNLEAFELWTLSLRIPWSHRVINDVVVLIRKRKFREIFITIKKQKTQKDMKLCILCTYIMSWIWKMKIMKSFFLHPAIQLVKAEKSLRVNCLPHK